MENDKFEFHAPQYWEDFNSEFESLVEHGEDNACFGSLFDKITSECSVMSEERKYSEKPTSGTFMGLKIGERGISDKRSSVLCERIENNQSYVVKQVFSSTLDNVLNSPIKAEVSSPTRKEKIKQTPHKQGAYLYSVKSKLKTPRKSRNLLRDIIDNIGGDTQGLDECSNYGGLSTIKAENRFTIVQPFSFQERDEEFLRRKREKLQKAQEVVKIPEFHARPVPPFVLANNMSKLNIGPANRGVKTIKKVSTAGVKVVKARVPEELKKVVTKK